MTDILLLLDVPTLKLRMMMMMMIITIILPTDRPKIILAAAVQQNIKLPSPNSKE